MKILLADQCPWSGGILRLVELLKSRYSTEDIRYYVQDADCPWIPHGGKLRTVSGKWPEYWAMNWRFPWVLDCPSAAHDGRLKGAGLLPICGIDLLYGPSTDQTISGLTWSPGLKSFISSGFGKEVKWANYLCQLIGQSPKVVLPNTAPVNTTLEMTSYLATAIGVHGKFFSGGLIDFFSTNPPLLLNELPKANYWWINDLGQRWNSPPITGKVVIVPQGPALVLELAARGITLGMTGLGYLDQVRQLRDEFLPGLEVSLLQIKFDWKPPIDLIDPQVHGYLKNRKKAPVAPPDPDVLDKIRQYWSGRPTPLSYCMLGGELNPRFTEIEL